MCNFGDNENKDPKHIMKERQAPQPINAQPVEQEQQKQKQQSLYHVNKQSMKEYYSSVETLNATKKENTRERLVRRVILQNLGTERYKKIDDLKVKPAGSKIDGENIKLNHATGTKLLAEGQDVIEFNVAVNDHKQVFMPHRAVEGIKVKHGNAKWKEEEKVRWFNKSKFLTWTGLCKTQDQIEKKNKILRENRAKAEAEGKTANQKMDEVYGKKYEEKVAGKTLNQLRVKHTVNNKDKTDKTRFNIIGSTGSGKYSEEKLEKYIFELGRSVLKSKIDMWEWKDDKDLEQFKKINIVLQGHDTGGAAVALGAMRIKKWLSDVHPRFLNKVDFQIIQHDPTSRMDGAVGNLAEINHDPVSDKLAKKDPNYMPLGESANTTVIYSMHNMRGQCFVPQKVKGAKRVILTMGDHDVNLSKTDKTAEKETRQTYFAEKDGKVEAFRASGLGELEEGIFIADDNNNLIKLNNLEEYDILMKRLLKNTVDQKDRHKAIRSVVKDWFGSAEPVAEEKKAEKKVEAKDDEFERGIRQDFVALCSQIHDANKNGEDQIWKRIGRLGENPNEESVTYRQLRAAVLNVKTITESMTTASGKLSSREDQRYTTADLLDAMNRLSECANVYYDTHRGHQFTERGKNRREACDMVRTLTEEFYNMLAKRMGMKPMPPVTERKKIKDLTTEDGVKAGARIKELAANYGKWKKHFALREGCENTNIRDKADLFKVYEKDIEIYKATHQVKDWPKEIEDAIRAANYYKFQNVVIYEFQKREGKIQDPLMKLTQEHANKLDHRQLREPKLTIEEMDKNLTSEQLAAIDKIDRWFLRNYNNAGYVGRLATIRNHHGEVISELLSKSKRERLFIYYLLEKDKRKSPEIQDAFRSQTDYVPNLSKFKKPMLATKLKVMSRLFGDYVYMYKLTDVMQINMDYQQELQDCARFANMEKKQGEKLPDDPAEQRPVLLKDLYDKTKAYRDCLAKKQKDGVKKPEEDPEVVTLRTAAQTTLDALINADTALGKEQSYGEIGELGKKKSDKVYNVKNTNKEDLPDNTGTFASAGSAAVGAVPTMVNGWAASKDMYRKAEAFVTGGDYKEYSWRLKDSGLASNQVFTATGAAAIAGLGDLMSAIYGIYYLSKSAGGMHAGDIGLAVTNIIGSLGKTGQAALKAYETYKFYAQQAADFDASKAFEASKTLQGVGIGVSAISTGTNTYTAISGGLDMLNSKNSKELLKEKKQEIVKKKLKLSWETDEQKKQREAKESPEEKQKREKEFLQARYEENMLKLSGKMSERKATYAGIQAVGSAIGTVALVIPGIGTVIGFVGTALGALAGGLSGKAMTTIRTAMFDDYFKFDEYIQKAEKVMAKRNQEIYDMEEFKTRMRRSLAASIGFTDLKSACDQIAKRYADQICNRLYGPDGERATDEKEINGYIQLAKSFGLKVDIKNKKPAPELLARKMNGR